MRKEINRCECGNTKPKQTTDEYKTIICENCYEILSYEKPEKVKVVKSKTNKKERKVEKGRYKKKFEEIKLRSEEEQPTEESYGFDINKIYNEDCMKTMKRMADKEVDYVFTSPPYNIGGSYKKYGKKGVEHKDDMSQNEYLDWSIALIDELLRVTKQHVFYNIQEFAENRIALDTLIDHFKYKIKEKCIWAKDHGSIATNAQVMSCKWEYILIFSNQNPLQKNFEDAWFGGKFTNLIKDIKRGKNADADINKATFPLDLPRTFMQTFGVRGNLWYDPFMGTGTSARACLLEGRKWVGSEMSKKMHTRCIKNIKQAMNNPYFDFYEDMGVLGKQKKSKDLIQEVDGLKQHTLDF